MLCRVLCALLFVAWVGEARPELDTALFYGLWRSPFDVLGPLLEPVPGIRLTPWQLLLMALAPVCLASPGASGRRPAALDAAVWASLGCVAVTLLWGLLRGGGAWYAYYQLWRFLAGVLFALMLASVIRAPRDLRAVALTIVLAALVRATLVMYFYWVHVRGTRWEAWLEYMSTHDDSLLFAAAILIVGCWALVERRALARTLAAAVSVYILYAMVLNDRRIVWVELAMASVAIYFLLGRSPWRRRLNRYLLIAAPFLLVYVAVGWGREGAIFAPVRAFSSVGSNEDASSLARLEENRNLMYTMLMAGNPLLGTGWGVPYQKLTSMYANYASSWELALYTPHNSLLGIAVFSGLAGILGIWCVVPVAGFLATRGYSKAADSIRRAAAMAAVGIGPAYSVHCFGDIGFQSLPCNLILAVGLATAGRLAAWRSGSIGGRTRGDVLDTRAATGVPGREAAVLRPALRARPSDSVAGAGRANGTRRPGLNHLLD